MAKHVANGGGAPKSRTSEEYDAIRRASKAGKNKRTKGKTRVTNKPSPVTVVRHFDAHDFIVNWARNKGRATRDLGRNTFERRVAFEVLKAYANSLVKAGDTPEMKHYLRLADARQKVEKDVGIVPLNNANRAPFNTGFLSAKKALDEGSRIAEFCRTLDMAAAARVGVNNPRADAFIARFTDSSDSTLSESVRQTA